MNRYRMEGNKLCGTAGTMDFDKLIGRTGLYWAAVALLVTLCALLAGLQHRWIGEVAGAEGHRLREDLQSRLNLLRRDLNDEISAACYAYIPANWEIQKLGRDEAYLSQYRQRKKIVGDHVVQRIAVAVPENGDLAIFFPDATGTHLVRGAWPPEWTPMHNSLIVRLHGGPAPMNQSSTLVEFPRFASENSPSGPRFVEQEWLLLDLDPDYVGQTLVPEMLNRYLGQSGNLEYDAEVTAKVDPAFSIYRSSDPAGQANWIPDASVDLLEIGRIPQPAITTGASRAPRSNAHPAGAAASSPASPSRGFSAPPPQQSNGLWILRVHHHAGSLEATVTEGRRRNNLLSAGLLLLLFTTTYALVRFSRRAQALANLQMNFVAGVSHELRTPLTVIRTAAYNLRGELITQPEQVARYSTLIRQEAEKLSALVDQVLRYGNARAGRTLQPRQPVAVPELIEASLLAARSAYPEKDLVVEKCIEPDLPFILADRESMQHALQNLFDNAVKYGAKGGAKKENWIGISAAALKNGGLPEIEIRVCDRGPGVPAEERQFIFDPFFRGRRPQEDQIHGTGLGLNLVKKIVEAHGGTVALHNREERGAEFVVRIPGTPAPSSDNATPAGLPAASQSEPSR
ncbi:MAG: HAMP domain-containing histidine kinase [Acidobacteriota bacterium]|nr:HAMP domain-containing histidine kinase [Acidobacteriota bacterium]